VIIYQILTLESNMSDKSTMIPLDIAVVSGAGRGIGRAIAFDLAAQGVQVLCISLSEASAETEKAIRDAGGEADSLQLDVTNFSTTRRKVDSWLSNQTGARVGLVLAAGVLGPSGSLFETALEEWDRAWRTNVLGNLAVVQGALPTLFRNKFGRILFFGGGGAAYAYPLFPAYAASKAALVRVVENLAEDLKGKGNFATAILAPGAVNTDMLTEVKAKGGFVKTTTDISEPTKFARSFLSSTDCSFSGCFVHVRDSWERLLNGGSDVLSPDMWKLRRVE
jgi:3-oxoacyl-[acyl-carrier protein] reductase